MDNQNLIKLLRRSSKLPPFTAGFCSEIASLAKNCPNELLLLVAALCLSIEDGDVCIKLCDDERLSIDELNKTSLRDDIFSRLFKGIDDSFNDPYDKSSSLDDKDYGLYSEFKSEFYADDFGFMKSQKALLNALHNEVVGSACSIERTPLVYDIGRLYFRRYFAYERQVSDFINGKDARSLVADNEARALAKSCLDELFGRASDKTQNSIKQKCAAALALMSPFTVISGGPGTGKTTTVTKLLLTLLTILQSQGMEAPRIKLCAPTGKAAGRLGQSLDDQLTSTDAYARDEGQISIVDFIKKHSKDTLLSDLIPRRATTVHSLIGVHPHTNFCNYNKKNPLPCDILVVDEVSMIDLMLFSKLIEALSENTIVILLGDKDQLCSVEAGSVMADLCTADNKDKELLLDEELVQNIANLTGASTELLKTPGEMSNHVMFLTHSFRFEGDSGIGNLAKLVRDGSLSGANDFSSDKEQLFLENLAKVKDRFVGQMLAFHTYGNDDKVKAMHVLVKEAVEPEHNSYREFVDFIKSRQQMTADDAKQALALLNKFRILCSNRNGVFGTRRLNNEIKLALMKDLGSQSGDWFTGRVVMATQNSQSGGVHNGDVGFVFVEHDKPMVWFEDEQGGARAVSTVYLTNCEDAYAMTVHKSQGSEYDRVVMALSDKDNGVLSRELVYTGITRARAIIEVYSDDNIFTSACLRSVQRQSGLSYRLMH